MKRIGDIRPLYPVVPVKRRDDKSREHEHKPAPKPVRRYDESDGDPDRQEIDEYV